MAIKYIEVFKMKLSEYIKEKFKDDIFNTSMRWKKTLYMIDVSKKLEPGIFRGLIEELKTNPNWWSYMCLSILHHNKFITTKWLIAFLKTQKNIEKTPYHQELINTYLENLGSKRIIFDQSNGKIPRGILCTLRDRPLMEFDLMQVNFSNHKSFITNQDKLEQIYRYDIAVRTDLINGAIA